MATQKPYILTDIREFEKKEMEMLIAASAKMGKPVQEVILEIIRAFSADRELLANELISNNFNDNENINEGN